MDPERRKKKLEFIKAQANYLRQSGFDSVHIFCTQQLEGEEETLSVNCGSGNFQAQIGQVREWLLRMDTYVVEDAKKDCAE